MDNKHLVTVTVGSVAIAAKRVSTGTAVAINERPGRVVALSPRYNWRSAVFETLWHKRFAYLWN